MADASHSVRLESLTRWQQTEPSLALPANFDEKSAAATSKTKNAFPFDEKLNRKLILCQENICNLVVDAIVNTTNERLDDRTGVAGKILERAGPDLIPELERAEGCHTGEAVMTKGYNLFAGYIIHTVGPRFSVKYQTAAENALHGCYRRSLELLKEHGLESIAFPLVNTERKGYPKEPAAHVTIRTIRRFLEKYGNTLHTIVLCMDNPQDVQVYQRVLPLYFPRSSEEEVVAHKLLPEDTGNELGESVIAERQIRISAMPGLADTDDVGSSDVAPRRQTSYDEPEPDHKEEKNPFTTPQANPDEVRATETSKEKDLAERERRYQRYLERVRGEDFSDLAQLQFIYQSGVDLMNRPVVVFVANRLPASNMDLERLQAYLVQFLDPIVESDYSIVYCHTGIQATNKPPFKWLREVYDVLARKYKKNLKALYIVHPSVWVKLVMWFVSPFVSGKFWKKLVKIDRLKLLWDDVDATTLHLPDDVVAYDRSQNSADYANNAAGTASAAAVDASNDSL